MHPYLLCRVARIPHNPKFSLAAVLGEPVKRGEAEQMQRGKLVKCEQMQSGVQQVSITDRTRGCAFMDFFTVPESPKVIDAILCSQG
eukprot:1158917-Pelagomonas_calceolata.AAC.7